MQAQKRSKYVESIYKICMSSYAPFELLSDRTRFKLYAAESHLNKPKELQAESGNLAGSNTRIFSELEIECFFLK
jgi:hypothetical protein